VARLGCAIARPPFVLVFDECGYTTTHARQYEHKFDLHW
jgi:hypothetical protein